MDMLLIWQGITSAMVVCRGVCLYEKNRFVGIVEQGGKQMNRNWNLELHCNLIFSQLSYFQNLLHGNKCL